MYKVLKPFSFAHSGITVVQYAKDEIINVAGQEDEFFAFGLDNGFIELVKDAGKGNDSKRKGK